MVDTDADGEARRAQVSDTPDFAGTDRFKILRRLGRGGMGAVYEALDRERNVSVALKTLLDVGPDDVLRLKHEFRALHDLGHPNLVSIGEFFEHQGRWFFTMELVRGVDILSWMRPGAPVPELLIGADLSTQVTRPLNAAREGTTTARLHERTPGAFDEARVRAALQQLALGLQALHHAGKVHRDIKPANVRVTDKGRVVILDFGMIFDLVAEPGHEGIAMGGTVPFMAPEQAEPGRVGPAADWYAVGVLLYLALTGELPFMGAPPVVLELKRFSRPHDPRAVVDSVPDDLAELCLAMLDPAPERRPSGPEVLRRVGASVTSDDERVQTSEPPFVGRRQELDFLHAALRYVGPSHPVKVFVCGESGLGKSSLVRRFAREVEQEDPNRIVLAGRCYERESVPYKAVDELMDSLVRSLASLPEADRHALLPAQAALCATMFPVLRRVVARELSDEPEHPILDPQQVRTQALAGLRELFSRLARDRTVVLLIDDLQWSDADSLLLLAELLRPPAAPGLMLVGTVRPPHDGRSSAYTVFDLSTRLQGDLRVLDLHALTPEDARALASTLLVDMRGDPGEAAATNVSEDEILSEANGHPLFIDALVRHRVAGGGRSALRLEEALLARVARLDPSARSLMEVVAVAGTPLANETAALTAGLPPEGFAPAASTLRAANLVRTSGLRKSDRIEPYHDRVREAVVANLAPPSRQRWHGRLAVALNQPGRADPEVLGIHWRESGEPLRAADAFARAGDQANAALAFDRAARLYRSALELRGGDDALGLREKLGDALAAAGRGTEAARVYREVASQADRSQALVFSRRATEQLLRSGCFDEGLELLREALSVVGLRMRSTPRRALLSLLWRRARLRMRGLDFTPRAAETVDPAELARIDTCWVAGMGLAMTDNIRGADFQTQNLLLSLASGEPHRVARAIALEIPFVASVGPSARARKETLLARGHALAEQLGDPYTLGLLYAADGASELLFGQWAKAQELSDKSEAILRERCAGVAWERSTVEMFALWALWLQGRVDEYAHRVPFLRRSAEERGDLYAHTHFMSGYSILFELLLDDVEGARQRSLAALERWSHQGFHLQHFYDLVAQAHIALYEGDWEAAYRNMLDKWPLLRSSFSLRLQVVRAIMLSLRSQLALLGARQTSGAAQRTLLRDAKRGARRLAGEGLPYTRLFASLTRAGHARIMGRPEEALRHLADATTACQAADMSLYATVIEWHRGALLGGSDGAARMAEAETWLRARGIKQPGKVTAMLAAGLA